MHKCIRCGNTYQDNDASILRGCGDCGSIFFLYMKTTQDAQQIDAMQKELQAKDTSLEKELTKQIEERKAEEKKEEKIELVEEGEFVRIRGEEEEEIKEEVKEEEVKVEKPKKIEKGKFGVETVRIPKEGIYEINIDALMKKRPLIILEKGRIYLIHLPSAFGEVGEL